MQMKLCWHSMLAHQCLPLPVRVSEYRQPFSCAYCAFTKLIHIESSKWYGISYLRLHPCRLPLRQETRQVPTLTVQHRGRLPRQRLRLEGASRAFTRRFTTPSSCDTTRRLCRKDVWAGCRRRREFHSGAQCDAQSSSCLLTIRPLLRESSRNDIEYWNSVKAAAWFCPPSLTGP